MLAARCFCGRYSTVHLVCEGPQAGGVSTEGTLFCIPQVPDVSLALGHQRLVFNVHKNEMVSLWNPITALGSYFFWTKTCLKNERLDRGEKEQHCLNHLRADFYHLKGTSQESDFHSACTAAISAVLIGCVDIADFFTWVVDMLSLLSATGDGACVWCRCLLRRSLLLAEV